MEATTLFIAAILLYAAGWLTCYLYLVHIKPERDRKAMIAKRTAKAQATKRMRKTLAQEASKEHAGV